MVYPSKSDLSLEYTTNPKGSFSHGLQKSDPDGSLSQTICALFFRRLFRGLAWRLNILFGDFAFDFLVVLLLFFQFLLAFLVFVVNFYHWVILSWPVFVIG
jgi:hypothetical protein